MASKLSLGFFLCIIFAFFSMCGGRSNEELKKYGLDLWGWDKANRFWGRLFSPTFFSLGLIGLSIPNHLKMPLIASICLLFASSHIGYTYWYDRIVKAVFWASIGIPLCFISGLWWLLVLQYIIAISANVILGTQNPLEAPLEEMSIYFFMTCLLPAMIL